MASQNMVSPRFIRDETISVNDWGAFGLHYLECNDSSNLEVWPPRIVQKMTFCARFPDMTAKMPRSWRVGRKKTCENLSNRGEGLFLKQRLLLLGIYRISTYQIHSLWHRVEPENSEINNEDVRTWKSTLNVLYKFSWFIDLCLFQFCRNVWLGLYDTRSHMEPDSKDESKIRDFMTQKYEKKRWYVAPTEAMHEEARKSNTPAAKSDNKTNRPLANNIPQIQTNNQVGMPNLMICVLLGAGFPYFLSYMIFAG